MTDVLEIPVTTIDGEATTLAEHAGKVLLVVNVASKCGLTPQYEGLEALYEATRDRGFEVLGFPANDFGGQEPGTDAEIAEFCSTNYSRHVPDVLARSSVTGDRQAPALRRADRRPCRRGEGGDDEAFRENLRGFDMNPTDDPEVLWNFEKFLIAKDGTVARRFAPDRHPRRPGAGRGHRGRARPLTQPWLSTSP